MNFRYITNIISNFRLRRIRRRVISLLVSFLAITSVCLTRGSIKAQERVIALLGGTVIDGTGRAPQSGYDVLIRGERIASVGRKIKIPKGAIVINVAGKTIIPGLIDMHGHMYARVTPVMRSQFEAYPLLYLAGGITTIRSPGDFEPEGMIALRERIKRGEATGPRIFTCGPYFDNHPSQVSWIKGVATPEEALEQFNRWKDRIDCVKFYTRITEPEFRAVIGAARQAGIPTTGHLESITATRAIKLGINGLEHGIFAMSELSKSDFQGGYCALGDLDLHSLELQTLVASIVKNQVAIDPTIVVLQLSMGDLEPVTPDLLKYLGADSQTAYQSRPRPPVSSTGSSRTQCFARAIQTQLRFVKMVHDRGGIVLAGTDPVSPRLLPGYALHRELKKLVDAGLTPVEAIKAATLNAAAVLHRQKEIGTIQAGKLADLVVVAGEPGTRIEEVGKTEIVFKGGVQYNPVALRKSAEGKVK